MMAGKKLPQHEIAGDILEKVLKAKKRLGLSKVRLLKWATEFSQVSLREVSPEKLKTIQFEVFAFFISMGAKGNGMKARTWSLDREGTIKPFPTPEQVRSIQRKLFETLEACYKGQTTNIHLRDITFELDPGFRSRTMEMVPRVHDIEDGVHLLFVSLLSQHGPVGKCPACQKYFVLARGKKKFCKKQCQANLASRRHRTKRKTSKNN